MSQSIQVNGQTINYPETGDTNWADDATNFAIQTSAALGKIGLSSGTSVDITQTLDVTGNTTLDANLSVGGNASVTGNTTLTGNLTVNGNTQLGNANTDTIGVTGIVNVDSGVLYVDPVSNRVGINDITPSVALDVTGDISASGNLSVNGNTTLGDASGDSLTINSNGVSIPNGLNFDSNTLVIDATNNKIGIGTNTPNNYSDSNTISQTILRADQSLTFGAYFQSGVGQYAFINSAAANKNTALPLKLRTGDLDKLEIAANGQLSAVVSGGSTLYPGFLCRAWVNFNGTGTVAIRASGNVSSITDNGIGAYTVNYTTAMPDINYATSIMSGDTTNFLLVNEANYFALRTVSSTRIDVLSTNLSSRSDSVYISFGVFR